MARPKDRIPDEVAAASGIDMDAVREAQKKKARASAKPLADGNAPTGNAAEQGNGATGEVTGEGQASSNGTAALSVLPGGKKPLSLVKDDADLRDHLLDDGKLYAHGQGAWREYLNGVWEKREPAVVKDHCQRLMDKSAMKTTWPKIKGITDMASIRVEVPAEEWDADTNVIACQNGVLHLPTRTLLPHKPENYLTAKTDYDYDPMAKAPWWDFFLSEFTDPEKVDFLQEFSGYCLTTNTKHEMAAWLYGPKGGGRSTFTLGLETVVGPRAGVLGLAKLEKSQFALGDIVGKTLLTATEQPGGYTEATFILNAIISGDRIEVEKKYKDPFQIRPTAKLLWSMNYLPRVADPGDGLFRRVAVVEIPKPEDRVFNIELKDHVQNEGAGILNWALKGLDRLEKRGRFELPPSIQEATERFEMKNDIPAAFVAAVCVKGNRHSEQATPLYKAYRRWCETSGHRAQSSTSIADDWERLGFKKYTSGGYRRYRGVMLDMDAVDELGLREE